MNAVERTEIEPILISIAEAARQIGLGRTKFYEILDTGKVETKFLGARRLVVFKSLKDLVAQLPTSKSVSES